MIEGIPLGVGDMSAVALLALVVILVITGRLVWHKVMDRLVDSANAQAREAVEALREAHEVNRLYAESIRELTASNERLADGQDAIITLVRAALPAPQDGGVR